MTTGNAMPDQRFESRTRNMEEIVDRDPTTALYLPLAERLREEGRVEEAIRLCEARKNRPGHGVGDAIVLGRCYLADGRLNDARSEFEAALALDRENVSALKALAGILAHEGRHARAIDLYRAVCRVDSGDLESQTALHQITSGEYADVLPADVVVGQGELGWQPVQLPREEENLPDLALGLRNIESFEAGPAHEQSARAQSLHELSLEELERATSAMAPDGAPAAPAADPAATAPAAPADTTAAPGAAPADTTVAPEAGARGGKAPAAPAAPTANTAPPVAAASASAPDHAAAPGLPGNRTAFEDWLRRLGGGS
jgi:tetratricopeptide (TPR) repeat protein